MRQITHAAKLHLKVQRQQVGDLEETDENGPHHPGRAEDAVDRGDDSSDVGGTPVESERRLRREIANSNERRRMQSINTGFQNLKTLLPHHEGEKMSKATILQQTADYVKQLEEDKKLLEVQNTQLQKAAASSGTPISTSTSGEPLSGPYSPTPKRRKKEGSTKADGTDEGIVLSGDQDDYEKLRSEVVRLRSQLGLEKQRSMALEQYCMILPAATATAYRHSGAPTNAAQSVGFHAAQCAHQPGQMAAHQRQPSYHHDTQDQVLDYSPPIRCVPSLAASQAPHITAAHCPPAALRRGQDSLTPLSLKISKPGDVSTSGPPSSDHTMSQKNLQTIVQAIEQIEGSMGEPAPSAHVETKSACKDGTVEMAGASASDQDTEEGKSESSDGERSGGQLNYLSLSAAHMYQPTIYSTVSSMPGALEGRQPAPAHQAAPTHSISFCHSTA